MQVNWEYIKMLVLLGLVVFLFAFASKRNANRIISQPKVKFVGENNLLITNEAVSKLLMQNYGGVKGRTKKSIILNELEFTLKSNPMIKSAEVYINVNGTLNARVVQKTPIARVNSNTSYYIDDEGLHMPLSNNYTVRVPLVTGHVEKNNLESIYKIANKIRTDDFLKKNVYEINQNTKENFYLRLRKCNFLVRLGNDEFLNRKVSNLKAFYKKNQKDNTLNNYREVNLQFGNQVICTKI